MHGRIQLMDARVHYHARVLLLTTTALLLA